MVKLLKIRRPFRSRSKSRSRSTEEPEPHAGGGQAPLQPQTLLEARWARPVLRDVAEVERPCSTSLGSPGRRPISKGESPGRRGRWRGARPGHTHPRAHLAGGCTAQIGLSGAPTPPSSPNSLPSPEPRSPGASPAPNTGRAQPAAANRYRAPSHAGGAGQACGFSAPQHCWSRRQRSAGRRGGAPRARPATLTTTASLSATDPAIFLPGAAGYVGRSARAGIPGLSCAGRGRGRGSELARARAHTRGRARARPGPGADLAGRAWEEGSGGRQHWPGGPRCSPRPGTAPDLDRRCCLLPLPLPLPDQERWQGPCRVGPGQHLKASGARLGNREQGGDPAGLPRLAQRALPLGHWTVAEAGAGGTGLSRSGRAGTLSAHTGQRVGRAGAGEVRARAGQVTGARATGATPSSLLPPPATSWGLVGRWEARSREDWVLGVVFQSGRLGRMSFREFQQNLGKDSFCSLGQKENGRSEGLQK